MVIPYKFLKLDEATGLKLSEAMELVEIIFERQPHLDQ